MFLDYNIGKYIFVECLYCMIVEFIFVKYVSNTCQIFVKYTIAEFIFVKSASISCQLHKVCVSICQKIVKNSRIK